MNNKVIIVTGDHHNGLNVARCLGTCGIYSYGIIITESPHAFIAYSKYWKKTWIVNSEDQALQLLDKKFGNEVDMPVIIPCTDGIAYLIDNNYNILKDKYIIPSIAKKQGKISFYMDKWEQIKLLEEYNLPVIKTLKLNITDDILNMEIPYPCIVKPIISAKGKKEDIRKCVTPRDLKDELSILDGKGYKEILVQEFIPFDNEFVFIGSVADHSSWILCKKKRIWPAIGGCSSYLQISDNEQIKCVTNKLLYMMENIGYKGLFDIDLFLCNGQVFINEINWRSSGVGYVAMGVGINYVLHWYQEMIKIAPNEEKNLTSENMTGQMMDDALDVRHVIYGELSFTAWIKDLLKAKSFSLWSRRDPIPAIIRYKYLFREMIRRI